MARSCRRRCPAASALRRARCTRRWKAAREWGIYLVSKGGDKPYRLKMRSPSFCNLSALREMTIGQFLADAVMILGSMDIVLCDVDR
jgi:NADH:ubiquinone oxidoreductase subunit D